MDKKKLIRIIIPICIILIVAGIWIVKNSDQNLEAPDNPGWEGDSANLVTPLNNEDFALETTSIDLGSLTAYGLPIIIDFGADSCIPCKEMTPVLKTLNAEMQGKAIIKFVDVWENSNAADGFPLQVIPTQVFINPDGTPYTPSDAVKIKFDMYSYEDTDKHAFTVHQGGLTEEEMRSILVDMGVAE
ncbi:MAG: thioredoxin family protein [Eubacteriales bacterium]|nr:thioredoxin family protein [Eubacteriales bacterium]MDD4565920.1 thioredoxin family protein [Eubacteriales bacterium]